MCVSLSWIKRLRWPHHRKHPRNPQKRTNYFNEASFFPLQHQHFNCSVRWSDRDFGLHFFSPFALMRTLTCARNETFQRLWHELDLISKITVDATYLELLAIYFWPFRRKTNWFASHWCDAYPYCAAKTFSEFWFESNNSIDLSMQRELE